MVESFKFVHAADIHLGSICRVKSYDKLPFDKRTCVDNAVYISFSNLVTFSLENEVDFLILSGDVFDVPKSFVSVLIYLKNELDRLNREGIKVFIINGNHDYHTDDVESIKWPENVYWFAHDKVSSMIFGKDDVPLALIMGISFKSRVVNDNLVPLFSKICIDEVDSSFDLSLELINSLFKIGIVHTNLDGMSQDNYAPCTTKDLIASDIDYWALGHVHNGCVVKANDPCIVYPGNIQSRGKYESGAKGAMCVEASAKRVRDLEFIELDVVRFESLDIDVTGILTIDALFDSLCDILSSLSTPKDGFTCVELAFSGTNVLIKDIIENVDETNDFLTALRDTIAKRGIGAVWIDAIKDDIKNEIDEKTLGGMSLHIVNLASSITPSTDILTEALGPLVMNRSITRFIGSFTDEELLRIVERAKNKALSFFEKRGM